MPRSFHRDRITVQIRFHSSFSFASLLPSASLVRHLEAKKNLDSNNEVIPLLLPLVPGIEISGRTRGGTRDAVQQPLAIAGEEIGGGEGEREAVSRAVKLSFGYQRDEKHPARIRAPEVIWLSETQTQPPPPSPPPPLAPQEYNGPDERTNSHPRNSPQLLLRKA